MDVVESLATTRMETAESDLSPSSAVIQSSDQLHIAKDRETAWLDFTIGALAIVQLVFLVTLCVCGTLVNSLVFWIFNRRPALRSLSNRFVLSLVTANIVISSVAVPLVLLETVLRPLVYIPCAGEIISMISNSIIYSAIFSTLLIAIDRFYAVTSPLHYSMTITRSRSQIMIVIAWLSGSLLSLPYAIICSIPFSFRLHQNLQISFTVVQVFVGYVFPFLSLCWLYVRMYNAAHRNSERTRKHSISGELLTVMDGTTSMIPQGIDFLTHYMNPFSKTPMAGSVQATTTTNNNSSSSTNGNNNNNNNHQNSITSGATPVVKKHRRRSSNGSASSLLFREEGRAIKTAFLVLACFLLCWTPTFLLVLFSGLDAPRHMTVRHRHLSEVEWPKFFSLTGMLFSAILHPFIYVFRNKMAYKEVSKLTCSLFRSAPGKNFHSKENQPLRRYESGSSRSGGSEYHQQSHNHNSNSPEHHHYPLHHPVYTPSTKNPKRSSMKSLTPQSSLNSTITNVNSLGPDSPIILNSTGDRIHFGGNASETGKPPFLRSLTLPEAPHLRVKFPPNLIRQKSYYPRTSSSSGCSELTPALSRKSRFVRQDSICSITSNDSVLVICAEDGISVSDVGPPLSQAASRSTQPSSSSQQQEASLGHENGHNHYNRQDSNFSDTSHKTTDSGVVIDMIKISTGTNNTNANNAASQRPPAPPRTASGSTSSSMRDGPSNHPRAGTTVPYLQTVI